MGATVATAGSGASFPARCPALGGSATPAWYTGNVSLCGCGAGHYNAGAHAGIVRCAKLGGLACDPAKNQWTIRKESAWRAPNLPGAQTKCGNCPPHSSLRGAARPVCHDAPALWRSARSGVSCADLRLLKACTRDGQYGGGWNPGWGDWNSSADRHGVTALQVRARPRPRHP